MEKTLNIFSYQTSSIILEHILVDGLELPNSKMIVVIEAYTEAIKQQALNDINKVLCQRFELTKYHDFVRSTPDKNLHITWPDGSFVIRIKFREDKFIFIPYHPEAYAYLRKILVSIVHSYFYAMQNPVMYNDCEMKLGALLAALLFKETGDQVGYNATLDEATGA